MKIISRHLLIKGRVQGVGFRAWTRAEACKLGLSGWVRNRREGTVEAVISGPDDAVEIMIAACRHGPTLARVEDIVITATDEAPAPGFAQHETA